MEKNFQSFGGLSITSRTRQSSSNSVFSGRRSLVGSAALKKGSVSSLSTRSNQSLQVIARSEYNIVESYGLPLPVLVNEALTFSERNSSVSVNCSDNGWAWAVYGRRLLAWQYKDLKGDPTKPADFIRTPQRRATTAQCRELTLPHCDIGHKASLITIFTVEGQQMASCLAVSPTGDVRFWPSVAHDGSSIDSTGILEGQEFDHLFSISLQGYVLITTTCNLVLLQLQNHNGRYSIHHKTIKPPTGFFGGIGKKFASIIIGMNSSQEKENKFLKAVGQNVGNDEWIIHILADRWIQKWSFSNYNEQFHFEDQDIIRKIRDKFQIKFWNERDANEIDIVLLDMQINDGKLYVLCGALNNSHSPQMHYAIVGLSSENDCLTLNSFYLQRVKMFYDSNTENECLGIKFIINKGMAYLYLDNIIYPVNLMGSGTENENTELERIEFHSESDKIINANVYSQIPLLFIKSHGFVCITPSDFDSSDLLNSSYSPDIFNAYPFSKLLNQPVLSQSIGNLAMYDLDPDEIYNAKKDEVNRLKAAFIYHLKRNDTMCNSILKELLPSQNIIDDIDSTLDKTVIVIAENLAEDIPAADPRWDQYGKSDKYALGSSASLQIISQLKEKDMAFNHFIEFLHKTGLWEKLNAISSYGIVKSTCHALLDIKEKIIAAIALKTAQNNFVKIVDEAIKFALVDRNEYPIGNLVHQDVFYVRLTKFHHIFAAFADIAEKDVKEQYQTNVIALKICEINAVVLAMLTKILQYRDNKPDLYTMPESKRGSFENRPWTVMTGPNGIQDDLIRLIDITLEHGARSTGEAESQQKLYQQMTELIDFVLDGNHKYLESIKNDKKYDVLMQQYKTQRKDLIYPLIEDGYYELAAKLAEKYLDFHALVLICDRTENQQRLDDYIEKYKEHDFSQFAINWHLRQNRQGDLFERFKGNQRALSRFLGDHPSLEWIQLIFNKDMKRASQILCKLAKDETEYIMRKKTMLSLAKLCALASQSFNSLYRKHIKKELELIDYQEQLPENLLVAFGYDTENQKVLQPEEIINLLISEENVEASEFDFRKALELTYYLEDQERSDEISRKIWCTTISRDSWTNYDMNSPFDKMQNMLFFKLIDICYLMDNNLENTLPSMEDLLTSPELGDLIDDNSFQFLLKLGYEHIAESYHNKNSL